MNAPLPTATTDAAATWDNPMGTDGFEFVEFAAPDPAAMGKVFEQMGFTPVAKHRHKDVTLYRQGGINFIVNAEPDSFAQRFARQHGPSVCAIARSSVLFAALHWISALGRDSLISPGRPTTLLPSKNKRCFFNLGTLPFASFGTSSRNLTRGVTPP